MPIFIRQDVSTYINVREVRAAMFDSGNAGSGVTLFFADSAEGNNNLWETAVGNTLEDIVAVLRPILDPHELMPIVQTTDEDPVFYWFNPEHVEKVAVVDDLTRIESASTNTGTPLTADVDAPFEVIVAACAKYND